MARERLDLAAEQIGHGCLERRFSLAVDENTKVAAGVSRPDARHHARASDVEEDILLVVAALLDAHVVSAIGIREPRLLVVGALRGAVVARGLPRDVPGRREPRQSGEIDHLPEESRHGDLGLTDLGLTDSRPTRRERRTQTQRNSGYNKESSHLSPPAADSVSRPL